MSKEPNKDLIDMLRAAESTEVAWLAEQSLLAEIIRRAVWDAFGSFREGKQGSEWARKKCALEAQGWLWSSSEDPWSYRWICDNINISPDILLTKIEIKLILDGMVKELRKPPNLSRTLRSRLNKRKREMDEKGTIINATNDLSDSEWGELFSDSSTRSEWDTWPND